MRLIFVSSFWSSVNETGSHQAKHMQGTKAQRIHTWVSSITHQTVLCSVQPPRNNTFVLKHNNNMGSTVGHMHRGVQAVPYNQALLKYFGRKCQIFWHLWSIGVEMHYFLSYRHHCSIKRHRILLSYLHFLLRAISKSLFFAKSRALSQKL